MSRIDENREFMAVRIAVLTVSDTRSMAEDRSGDTLVERLTGAGHQLAARAITPRDLYKWCSRIASLHETVTLQVVFQEAVDCFCCYLPVGPDAVALTAAMGEVRGAYGYY